MNKHAKPDRYRLIWFQHLHKAAGSSIVEMAKINHEIFFTQHKNGNPISTDGKLIRLWEMSAVELLGFIDNCEELGVTFVATEWGAPDFSLLAADPRITLITCLRDPLSRFVSDYHFAYRTGKTDCESLLEYADSDSSIWGLYTQTNYYCRIFSRHHHRYEAISQDQFELAKANLELFDCRVVLQSRDAFSHIKNALGWVGKEVHINRAQLETVLLSKLILRGKFKLLWRRLFHSDEIPEALFARRFKEQNSWDYQLMEQIGMEISTLIEED